MRSFLASKAQFFIPYPFDIRSSVYKQLVIIVFNPMLLTKKNLLLGEIGSLHDLHKPFL